MGPFSTPNQLFLPRIGGVEHYWRNNWFGVENGHIARCIHYSIIISVVWCRLHGPVLSSICFLRHDDISLVSPERVDLFIGERAVEDCHFIDNSWKESLCSRSELCCSDKSAGI